MARKKCRVCDDKQAVRPGGLCSACYSDQRTIAVPQYPVELIPLKDIVLDKTVQARFATNSAVVGDYAEAIQSGAKFPPAVVYRDDQGRNWLSRGFHRYGAHESAGLDAMDCEVRSGGRREAEYDAIGDNSEHGLRRTSEDKERAVEKLLADAEWSQMSTAALAATAKVSHAFADRTRKKWESSRGGAPATRTTRSGSEYPATRPPAVNMDADDPEPTEGISRARDADPDPAVPPDTPGGVGSAPVEDAYGAPVPGRIAGVFAESRPEMREIRSKLNAAIRDLREARERPGGVKLALSAIEAKLEDARRLIAAATPSCLCPSCRGLEKSPACKVCDGLGWWPDSRLASATNSQRRVIEQFKGVIPG